jgi:hypothetical protein
VRELASRVAMVPWSDSRRAQRLDLISQGPRPAGVCAGGVP